MTDDDRTSVARVPAWHPSALVALIVVVSATGSVLSLRHGEPAPVEGARITSAYLPLLAVSWGLLLYVCRVGRPRCELSQLLGVRGHSARRAAGDVALALVAAGVLIGGEAAWQLVFGSARGSAVDALLPATPLERVVWCAVAASVGLSEEVVYRGYLATELTRVTSSAVAGVLGQALLFAIAHANQGGAAMVRFFVYATGLGALAFARRSLMPGVLAHVGIDLVAGLVH